MDTSLFLLAGSGIFIAGLLLGLVFMRMRLHPDLRNLRGRLEETARRDDEVSGFIQKLQVENKNLSSFLVMLPDVARRLNSHLDQRNLAPLLANVLQHIFEPAQILIFLMKREEKQLCLAFKKGIGEGMQLGLRANASDGIIGWVASHQVTMDRDDFHHIGLRRSALELSNEDAMAIDLIAPMSYENECLGVISVGGISRKPSDHKRMIKMVADLGSLALYNHMLYSSFQAMANSDPLTKLCSKRFLMLRLGEEIHDAERTNQPLSVFLFDIDHFKNYNDTHGHLQGDELLRILGRLVRQEVREDDTAARYGGEEFVIILRNTKKEAALASAEKIRRTIEAYPFPHGDTQPLGRVTVSGGVATFGSDARTTNELLRAADQALYLAKEQGRNRIVAYKFRYLSDEEEVTA